MENVYKQQQSIIIYRMKFTCFEWLYVNGNRSYYLLYTYLLLL